VVHTRTPLTRTKVRGGKTKQTRKKNFSKLQIIDPTMQMHWTYNPRRPSSMFWRFLAPAKSQRWPSSCKFLIEVETLAESPSNTQAFRCFHMVQAPKMVREFTPFLCCLPTLLVIFLHQVAKLCSLLLGTSCCKLSGESTLCQNCLAKTHVVRIC